MTRANTACIPGTCGTSQTCLTKKIMNGKGNIALALGPMNGPTPRSVDDAVIPQAIRFKPTAMLGRSCVLSRAEQRK